MKTVKAEVDLCDCDCNHCDYSFINATYEVECPYASCGEISTFQLRDEEGINVVEECQFCEKKIRITLSINHI